MAGELETRAPAGAWLGACAVVAIVVVPLAVALVRTSGSPGVAWAGAAGLLLCAAGVVLLVLRLKNVEKQLQSAARIDALTRLPNRLALEEHLLRLAAGARRHGHELAVLMVDIDGLEEINDHLGHDRGDQVLSSVGAMLADNLRQEDFAGRWGDDAFLVLIPHASMYGAYRAAERIRGQCFHEDPPFTASIGIALLEAGEEPSSLVQRAAAALSSTTEQGRERIATSGVDGVEAGR